MAGSPTLQAVDVWVRQGLELRQKLEQEQAQLKKRLNEIERALVELPEAPLNSEDAAEDDTSVPKRVLAVLANASEPITASAVIEAIQREIPSIDPMLVHSALYRLVKREEVVAEGTKGKKTYRRLLLDPFADPPAEAGQAGPDDIPF